MPTKSCTLWIKELAAEFLLRVNCIFLKEADGKHNGNAILPFRFLTRTQETRKYIPISTAHAF